MSRWILSLFLRDKRSSSFSVYLGFLCSMMESVPVAEPEAFEIPLLLCHPEKKKRPLDTRTDKLPLFRSHTECKRTMYA